jgi:uncharacterized membrane protein YGL010W
MPKKIQKFQEKKYAAIDANNAGIMIHTDNPSAIVLYLYFILSLPVIANCNSRITVTVHFIPSTINN